MGEIIQFLERIPAEEAENIRLRGYARHRRRCHYLQIEKANKEAEKREQSQDKSDRYKPAL